MPHTFVVAVAQDAAAVQARIDAGIARVQAQAAEQMARQQAQMARQQAQTVREAVQTARDAARARNDGGMPMLAPPPFERPSHREQSMMFVGFIVVVIAGLAILSPLVRAIGRRIEGAPRRDAMGGASAERLERIEQAVEAMAVEIERISEGQRFTTKLLSSRAEADAALIRRL